MQRARFLTAVSVFALVIALYLPTLRGGFVYDSIAQVLHSDYLHTASNWAEVLTLRVVGQDELDRNRPLHLASLMLDAAIWGKNPLGYRLTSVVLHALNAALLFVFVAVVLGRRTAVAGDGDATALVAAASSPPVVFFPAAFGALVFALHPLVVEAVAEPSNREDLLVLLPLLIGLIGIVAPVRSPWVVNGLLVLCSFLAVLAKESGVAVPFVFALACRLFRRGDLRSLVPGLLGGLFASLAFLVISYVWRPEVSSIFAQSPGALADGFLASVMVQCRIWTLQLWQILWPWNLSAHYPPQAIAEVSLPLAIAVMAAGMFAAGYALRRGGLAALGVALYVLALLPASNLAPQFHPVADRYLYVPLAGLGLLAAAVFAGLKSRSSSGITGRMLLLGGVALLAVEYAANLRRQFIWQEPAALWTDVWRQYPRSAMAHLGLANVHYRAGHFTAARSSAAEAVLVSQGNWADALAMRALGEWQTGATGESRDTLQRAAVLSRVYRDEASLTAALVWSPDQLEVLHLIRQSAP